MLYICLHVKKDYMIETIFLFLCKVLVAITFIGVITFPVFLILALYCFFYKVFVIEGNKKNNRINK